MLHLQRFIIADDKSTYHTMINRYILTKGIATRQNRLLSTFSLFVLGGWQERGEKATAMTD